jgi:hypothetical protein
MDSLKQFIENIIKKKDQKFNLFTQKYVFVI